MNKHWKVMYIDEDGELWASTSHRLRVSAFFQARMMNKAADSVDSPLKYIIMKDVYNLYEQPY